MALRSTRQAFKKEGDRLRRIAVEAQEEKERHTRDAANREELRKLSQQRAQAEAQAKAEAEEPTVNILRLSRLARRR